MADIREKSAFRRIGRFSVTACLLQRFLALSAQFTFDSQFIDGALQLFLGARHPPFSIFDALGHARQQQRYRRKKDRNGEDLVVSTIAVNASPIISDAQITERNNRQDERTMRAPGGKREIIENDNEQQGAALRGDGGGAQRGGKKNA